MSYLKTNLEYNKQKVYVGKFTPPSADHVEQLMLEFIEWLNSNQLQQAHPIQIAALVHYKFVFIHPFYDGNGRTGRLLMNLILMKFGYPPVIIRKQERLEYYEYLEMANQGDIKPFVRFIARCTQRTLQEYIKLCNDSYSISVDDSAKMFRGDLVLNTFDDDYFRDTAKTGENNDDEADDEDDGGEPVIGESFINTGKFSFLPTQDDDGEN
jgi:prophage maintenance system killer protein